MCQTWKATRIAFHEELHRSFVPHVETLGFRPSNMIGAPTDTFGSRFDMPMLRISRGRLDFLFLAMLPQMPGALYTYVNCFGVPEEMAPADLDGADAMALINAPLSLTRFAPGRPERVGWFRRKVARAYMAEPGLDPETLTSTVAAEVARFIADMDGIETWAFETMRRTGIWRIVLEGGVIRPDRLIAPQSPEFPRLFGRERP